MLQNEETTGAWSEIGKMKKARSFHAVVGVMDVSLFCPGFVGKTNKKQLSSPPSSTPLFLDFVNGPFVALSETGDLAPSD